MKLYNVSTDDTYKLIQDLKSYDSMHSVFPFGEWVHYADTNKGFKPIDLQDYLEEKEHTNINIEITDPTIEDTFMELSNS